MVLIIDDHNFLLIRGSLPCGCTSVHNTRYGGDHITGGWYAECDGHKSTFTILDRKNNNKYKPKESNQCQENL